MVKRVILVVLDSVGIGAMPDAASFGDAGADTLGHILDSMPQLDIKTLRSLGFGNIQGAAGGRLATPNPKGTFGRCSELSTGKDTITGHWEIAGILTRVPFQTYPEGFPREFMDAFEARIGTETLGNYAASGTVIIEELGPLHEKTGKPIVYTSADSVFQIAANTDVIPLERLYEICTAAREMLKGPFACGRVIARPYEWKDGKRTRTADRRDYAVSPPMPTLLNHLQEKGLPVVAVGKISDIFNHSGITTAIHTESNEDGVIKTLEAMDQSMEGMIFTNLVDFDSKYGHRRDPQGYGQALERFDRGLFNILGAMRQEDVLLLCADHGNDPAHSGWDHTREFIPFVFYGQGIKAGVNLGTRQSFADLGATIADFFGAAPTAIGESMKKDLLQG